MNKEEMLRQFNENVEYLQRNVPPDDIYIFTEQTFMAALFFLTKWSEKADIEAECAQDIIAQKWVTNILGLLACRDLKQDINLDLNMECLDGG